jgi:hypothetical protein
VVAAVSQQTTPSDAEIAVPLTDEPAHQTPSTTGNVIAAADAPAETEAAQQEPVSAPADVAADEIAGVVLDADGKPVADALVDVWHWVPGDETRTDEHGVFRLKGSTARSARRSASRRTGTRPRISRSRRLPKAGQLC